jgi:uncharacterized protein (TIGR02145 family)
MRKIYILCLLILLTSALYTQVPQAFKYQAVARDLNGNPVINQEIAVKISILTGSPEGTVVYSEQHQITTNNIGLFTLEIGIPTQVLSGSFAAIDWGGFSHFLETAIDLTGSGEFQVLGVSQFLSVPYALFAGQTSDTTNWQKNQNVVYYNKGQVGIGTSQPDSSAKLDVNSNSQGFLPPRMTTEERDSIPNPAAGLIIFNTDTHCINFFNGAEWVEYGRDPMDTFECGQMFTDPRDKQQYRTVQIGEQCWFAENLNVGTKINASLNQTDNDVVEKFCYENVSANCSEFGGLYQWDEMMAYDTIENTKGICPEGWHLPNQAEWQMLFDAFGGAEAAGTELATTGTSGFDALMDGKFDAVAGFSGQNNLSTFWSSSGTPGAQATGFDFTSGNPVVNTSNSSVFNGYGVRCLKGLPNITNPNLKVIDTTVYNLVSDSMEMAQGIYRYEIIASRKAKDLIVANNIVVGTENYGYLRKVDETTINGNEMILTTSDATFEDAFIEGEFGFNADLTGKGNPVLTFTRIKYLAPGVEISPQKDGFTYSFTDVVIYEGDNLSVSIPQGHVSLDPAFKFDFKFKDKKIQRLAFYADNTIYENSIDVQLDVTASVSKEYEKTLAETEKFIVFWVGLVPVLAVITTQLTGTVDCSFDAAFMATTGYTNTNTVSFGVKYEYGSWQKIWGLNSTTQLHPITWSENISLEQNLSIEPEIDVKFYGIIGPYFNLPVWEKLGASITVPALDFDASLDVGLNGNLGASVTIFDETLADYSVELFGFEKNLYKTPAKVEMISGNNQTDTVNAQLSVPLIVKVTDSKGLTYLPARVHFTVETGGGILTETDLWTDANGFAQTTWTLGDLEGEQTVKAEVFKADGEAIEGSPITFLATANVLSLPDVTTNPVTDIAQTTATSGGNVISDGGATVTERGVCWSTSQYPTIANNKTIDGSGNGTFTSSITGLTASSTYFVRAYANNATGTGYGNQQSFTTSEQHQCGQPFTTTYDGKSYNTVLFGDQCWMQENLESDVGNSWWPVDWLMNYETGEPFYAITYNYGKLYDWQSAMTACPTDWHLPTDAEWQTLINYVSSQPEYRCGGNPGFIGKALASTSGWNGDPYIELCAVANNPESNNATGFSGHPGGWRDSNGDFYPTGWDGKWWSSREISTSACYYWLAGLWATMSQGVSNKSSGFSVRCLRDN